MNDHVQITAALTRVAESSPVIVLVLLGIGWFVWKAWREERKEFMGEIREERSARAQAHQEMRQALEHSTEALRTLREVVLDLRGAIKNG